MRGWLTCPVIGTGSSGEPDADNNPTPFDPYRAAVADRKGVAGDRLEGVIDPKASSTCLVAYDVADDSDLAGLGGEILVAEADLDKAADRIPEKGKARLAALARDSGVSSSGSAREVLRRIGRQIAPDFDERRYLGSAAAPGPGSFVEDTFTDADGTKLEDHTGELGASWTNREAFTTGNGTIFANRLAPDTAAFGVRCFYTASGEPVDWNQSAEAKLFGFDEAEPVEAGPVLRWKEGEGYLWAPWRDGKLRIYVHDGSGLTEKGSFETTCSEAHTIVFQAEGDQLKAFWDGTERIAVEYSDFTHKGLAGVRGYGGGEAAGVHIDNLDVTDIEGPTQPPENTAAPQVTGTAKVGETLSCSDGTWNNAESFAYQWQRSATKGSGYSNIAGATSSTYVLQEADANEFIRCVVTATNTGGSTEEPSNAVGPVEGLAQEVTLTALTETDALLGPAVSKRTALIALSDTSAAQPLSTRKRATLEPLADSSAIQAVAILKRPQLEALTETDAMQGLVASKRVALVPLSETDTLVAVRLLIELFAARLVLSDRATATLSLSDATTTDLALSDRAKTTLALKDGPPQ